MMRIVVLIFVKDPGWRWDKDGRLHYRFENVRNDLEVKIGNGGIEFGIHWR
ncbi:MAG: hypothetical protein LBD98_00195 [Endomicrobium sp.]|nr:hypothetical protein [Endomicrobium sp.]